MQMPDNGAFAFGNKLDRKRKPVMTENRAIFILMVSGPKADMGAYPVNSLKEEFL